jgi:hypothetical protein
MGACCSQEKGAASAYLLNFFTYFQYLQNKKQQMFTFLVVSSGGPPLFPALDICFLNTQATGYSGHLASDISTQL